MSAIAGPLLASAWRRALDLVFPPRCAGCGAFGEFLCRRCLSSTPRARPPRCPGCWMPVLPARPGSTAEGPGPGDTCARCRRRPFAFEAARSAFVYEGAAREAVHAIKYRGVSAIAGAMAAEMADVLDEWAPPVSALVPVPLAGRRRRSRGYNQSELLAQEIGRRCGLPVRGRLLVRRGTAAPQARAADEAARWTAAAGAFAVRASEEGAGSLLLVDDVMTSGATLEACARSLRAAGRGPVYALTFARED